MTYKNINSMITAHLYILDTGNKRALNFFIKKFGFMLWKEINYKPYLKED